MRNDGRLTLLETRLDALGARLDARPRSAPGQLPLMAGGAQPELNLQGSTASQAPGKPPAVGRAAKAAATRKGRAGKPCGNGHIAADLSCRKSGAGAMAAGVKKPKVIVQLRRAKPGGETGPDGHWYPGGAWMSKGSFVRAKPLKLGEGEAGGQGEKAMEGDREPTVIRNKRPSFPERPTKPNGEGLPRPTGLKKMAAKNDELFFGDDGYILYPRRKTSDKMPGLEGSLFEAAVIQRMSTEELNWATEQIKQQAYRSTDPDRRKFFDDKIADIDDDIARYGGPEAFGGPDGHRWTARSQLTGVDAERYIAGLRFMSASRLLTDASSARQRRSERYRDPRFEDWIIPKQGDHDKWVWGLNNVFRAVRIRRERLQDPRADSMLIGGDPDQRDRLDPIGARLEALLKRLDARRKASPGQLDLLGGGGAQTEIPLGGAGKSKGQKPAAVGRASKAAAASKGRAGKPCGDGHIAADLTCRKGAGETGEGQAGPEAPADKPAAGRKGGGATAPADPRKGATGAIESGDYEFARKSEVPNAGEDLALSARHRRNMFSGLAEEEAAGTAEKNLTRDNLLKATPHDLIAGMTPANTLSSLQGYLTLQAFPARPYGEKELASYQYGNERRKTTGTSPENLRKQYHDAFKELHQLVHAQANEIDPRKNQQAIQSWIGRKIDELRQQPDKSSLGMATAKDPFNPVANSLIDLSRRIGRRGSTTVPGKMEDFSRRLKAAMGNDLGSAETTLAKAKEAATRIMEGASFNEAFGTVGADGKKRFNPADLYVAPAKRQGGRNVGGSTIEQGTDFIIKGSGFRGLQFGNSVSDDERKHHLKKAAEALADLADVTGLPDEAMGLNGSLGLAIGARGRGTALAHFEPKLKVINLTRKRGIGTLSHEWGHALDNYLGLKAGVSPSSAPSSDKIHPDYVFLTNSGRPWEKEAKNPSPVIEAMKAVQEAHVTSGFMDQVEKESRGIKRAMAFNRDYWISRPEMFARSFEAHIDRKLAAAGRKNTYLTQTPDSLLWPTAEQSAAMAAAFDRLLDAVRTEHFANAPKRQDARGVRIDRFMALLDGRLQSFSVGHGDSLRALEIRVERLDARRKAAPGQMDLFGGKTTEGDGLPCGESYISRAKQCRKGESGGGPLAQNPLSQKGQPEESGLIPTALPFTDSMAARIVNGIKKRTITSGTVNYNGDDLAAAMIKVAQSPQGENMRKALAFMEEAGIMPNIAAHCNEEIERITGKPSSELPWTKPLGLAKFVREAGLVSDERLEWLKRDQTAAGQVMVRKAEIVRNPPKPSTEENTFKKVYEEAKAYYKQKEEEFEQSVRDGWRTADEKNDVMWLENNSLRSARNNYTTRRDGRLNQIKWAAQDFISGSGEGFSSNENGGYYVAGRKKYVAVGGPTDESWNGAFKVDAGQTDIKNMRRHYSMHMAIHLPDKLAAMADTYDNFDVLHKPIGFSGKQTWAEKALGIHIHELGHVVDSFADVRVRNNPRVVDNEGTMVLSHEVNAWSTRAEKRPEAIKKLIREKRGPSNYALTNDAELFAESFASYVFAPQALKRHHPELHAWVDERLTQARTTMARNSDLKFVEER